MIVLREPHPVRTIAVLIKKELGSYFNSPVGYIVAAVFLAVGNWLFFKPFFVINEAGLRGYFNLLPWLLLFLAPALSMRVWAEERRMGTVEFLLTLPISPAQAVIAKFVSAWLFLIFILVLSISLPLSVSQLGRLDWGPVIGGYLGAVLLGGVYLAIGSAVSSFTRNQIIAFVASLAAMFAALILGSAFMLAGLPDAVGHLLEYLGLFNHFESLARGVVDTKDLVYLLTVIAASLWVNVISLKYRRW